MTRATPAEPEGKPMARSKKPAAKASQAHRAGQGATLHPGSLLDQRPDHREVRQEESGDVPHHPDSWRPDPRRPAPRHLRRLWPLGRTHVRVPVRQGTDGPEGTEVRSAQRRRHGHGRRQPARWPGGSDHHRLARSRRWAAASATGSTSATIGGTRSTSTAIEDKVPRGKFPKVTKKVGKSPPQYADEDE